MSGEVDFFAFLAFFDKPVYLCLFGIVDFWIPLPMTPSIESSRIPLLPGAPFGIFSLTEPFASAPPPLVTV